MYKDKGSQRACAMHTAQAFIIISVVLAPASTGADVRQIPVY